MEEKEKQDREDGARFLNIEHSKGYNIPGISNTWYKTKNAGELNFVIKWFSYDVVQVHGQRDLVIGEWFTVTIEHIPNIGWTRTFISLKNYKKFVNKMFVEISAIEKELE